MGSAEGYDTYVVPSFLCSRTSVSHVCSEPSGFLTNRGHWASNPFLLVRKAGNGGRARRRWRRKVGIALSRSDRSRSTRARPIINCLEVLANSNPCVIIQTWTSAMIQVEERKVVLKFKWWSVVQCMYHSTLLCPKGNRLINQIHNGTTYLTCQLDQALCLENCHVGYEISINPYFLSWLLLAKRKKKPPPSSRRIVLEPQILL